MSHEKVIKSCDDLEAALGLERGAITSPHNMALDAANIAAMKQYLLTEGKCRPVAMRRAVEAAIKAYLDASGMVMVPREATDDMRYAWNVSEGNGTSHFGKQYYSDMIAAAPNPFQTPEESREKK